jgi:hypothetical protein
VIKDPDLITEAERLRVDLSLVKGETLEALVKDLMATPDDVLKRAQVLMQP